MRKSNSQDWEPFKSHRGMIRLVLCVEWDPIGVFGYAEALDEYDGYVDEILALVSLDRPRDEIVDKLDEIATKRMGLRSSTLASRLVIADKILDIVSHEAGNSAD